MPCGKEIRGWRRVPIGVSVLIKQGKDTSSIGREPIEQEFLSASTLENPSVLPRPRSGERLKRPEGVVSESLSRLPLRLARRVLTNAVAGNSPTGQCPPAFCFPAGNCRGAL
jgi:hypothetical protein